MSVYRVGSDVKNISKAISPEYKIRHLLRDITAFMVVVPGIGYIMAVCITGVL